jgi:hypothetical protein
VEPSPVTLGLRGAVGLDIPIAVIGLYIEGAVDTSLVGGAVANLGGTSTSTKDVGPFDLTVVSVGAGVRLAF